MWQARQCPRCNKWGSWHAAEPICNACRTEAEAEFERDWRKLRHYLAFDQWLFDHGRLNDKENA